MNRKKVYVQAGEIKRKRTQCITLIYNFREIKFREFKNFFWIYFWESGFWKISRGFYFAIWNNVSEKKQPKMEV